MRTPYAHSARIAAAFLLASITGSVRAQQAAPASPAAPAAEEETVELSPFVVSAEEDGESYLAKATLAGSRIRTDLRDVASSISVVTSQFLRDTGATNNLSLLQYTTNTEVAGIYGNFGGVGNTFIEGASESLVRPSNNTRVRGLDSADNTRDYFLTDIPWDSYNVGRVDLQRGPNSILFGYGSPAGIINSSVNTAGFRTEGNFENRIGSFGSLRFSLDYNYVLLKDELSIRVAALDDDTKFRQDPAYNHDKRIFAAARWEPKFLRSDSMHTTLRLNYEHGDVDANRPRMLPPQDRISPYFGGLDRNGYDPYWAWNSGEVPFSSSAPLPGAVRNFWLAQTPGPGVQGTGNPMFYYDTGANAPMITRIGGPNTTYGLNADGSIGAGIDGFPYGSNVGIAGFYDYAYNTWRNGDASKFPAADKGFYKNRSMTDSSIFDFYNKLIDGPNAKEWQGWDSFNATFAQTFLNNRIGYELAYDRQKYGDGQTANLQNPFISVDIRQNLMGYPQNGNLPVTPNPNLGRAFTGSSSKGASSSRDTDRENFRATVYGEVRATDFMSPSKWASAIGRHQFTGVYTEETYDILDKNWARYAVDSSWSSSVGSLNPGLTNGDIVIDMISYLSPTLKTTAVPQGLNLPNVSAVQSPAGSYTITYFDSHWNKPTNPSAPGYVDPAAPWTNTARASVTEPNGAANTQSENPANYVGWVSKSFNVLNADEGDVEKLLTSTSNVRKKTTSKALTWQGYLFDDTLVVTYGGRRDKQTQWAGSSNSATQAGGVAIPNPALEPDGMTAEDTSASLGVVLHTPKSWREKLPWGSNISLTYSDGKNTRVENRYDFDGNPLENAKGRTKDIGVVISTLNDRLSFKATKYKTNVDNANLSTVSSETATLGAGTYYLKNLEAWGVASAMIDVAGREVDSAGHSMASGLEWYWNWALVDNGWDGKYNDPQGADFKNSPSTIAQTKAIDSWLAQMPSQAWFDAYGFPVNVAKAKAKDWRGAIAGWTPAAGVGGVQPSGGGRIKGSWPTGTANNESEGWEFELQGEPVKGLNVSINAAKQFASQTSLGESLINTIETAHAKYASAAGDLRLWWGGDSTVRQYFNQNIWSAYQFQLQTNGKLVAEMAPWRFNSVINYSFQGGKLKGANVGMGYRWQKGVILGYHLNEAKDNYDINSPIWGDPEQHFDLWAGYNYKISKKVTWRIQANLRNVGEDAHLKRLSVQPDGSNGLMRIEEGMTWQLTNTFSF